MLVHSFTEPFCWTRWQSCRALLLHSCVFSELRVAKRSNSAFVRVIILSCVAVWQCSSSRRPFFVWSVCLFSLRTPNVCWRSGTVIVLPKCCIIDILDPVRNQLFCSLVNCVDREQSNFERQIFSYGSYPCFSKFLFVLFLVCRASERSAYAEVSSVSITGFPVILSKTVWKKMTFPELATQAVFSSK